MSSHIGDELVGWFLSEFESCLNNPTFAAVKGECKDIPENCMYSYKPVCGCDKITYANDCVLEMNKESKDYDGECKGDCAEAGEIFGELDCCKGLTKVSESKPNKYGVCENFRHYICLELNDDKCGVGENWCNSEDCDKPEEETNWNSLKIARFWRLRWKK